MDPKVLVVEDEPDVCDLLCQILDMHGFHSEGVTAGYPALEQVESWQPDVMVLDLMLPDVDGLEICRRVKSQQDSKVGILVLTALQTPDARERAFQAGADRFLTKPFVPQDVIQQLRSVAHEYHEAQPGLRREIQLDISRPQEFLQGFLKDLFHTTPLPADTIAETGRALLRIANCVKQCQEQEAQRIDVACQVFRDRLQHTLRMEKVRPDRNLNGRDLFSRLFGTGCDDQMPTLVTQLATSVWFAEDRPEMVLTRTFV